jgi:hypothetical protein
LDTGAAPVGLADDVAEAPLKDGIAVVAQPGKRTGIEPDDRRGLKFSLNVALSTSGAIASM